jgi:ribonuclease-3
MNVPSFRNPKLFTLALTHRSSVNEGKSSEHNERLEYLGDAVLELCVSEYLYRKFPKETEGRLTTFRTALVRTETLAQFACDLGIPKQVIVSKGEERSGGTNNPSLLADTVEAVIGALYLDRGLESVKRFLEQTLLRHADRTIQESMRLDAKSKFQELVQAEGNPSPTYDIISIEGPDHDRVFTAQVFVARKPIATGRGKSKQEAEQEAAKAALAMVYRSHS